MAAVMAAGMTPPLGMALASTVRGRLFSEPERESGRAAWLLGASFISEGAIPFAVADPWRVIASQHGRLGRRRGPGDGLRQHLTRPPRRHLGRAADRLAAAVPARRRRRGLRHRRPRHRPEVDPAGRRGRAGPRRGRRFGRRDGVRTSVVDARPDRVSEPPRFRPARGVPSCPRPPRSTSMAQRTVTIGSAVGLHARPASLFVRAATATGLHVDHRPRRGGHRRRRRRRQHPGGHGPGRPPRRAGRAAAPTATARTTRSTAWPPCCRATWTTPSEPGAVAAAALRHRRQSRGRGRAGRADATAASDPRRTNRPLPTRRRRGSVCARRSTSVAEHLRAAGAAGRRDRAGDPRGHRDDGARPGAGHGRRRATSPPAAARPPPWTPRSRTTAPRSPRPAATSPSASPTCATSATGPSRVLLGLDEPGLPGPAEPCVLVGHDLAPAETAGPRPRPRPRDHHRGGRRAQPHGGPRRPAGHPGGRAAGCRADARRRHAGRRRRRHRAGGRSTPTRPTAPS